MSDDPRLVRAAQCLSDTARYPDPMWHAMNDLYEFAEERLRINVGLVVENAELRRQLRLAPAGSTPTPPVPPADAPVRSGEETP